MNSPKFKVITAQRVYKDIIIIQHYNLSFAVYCILSKNKKVSHLPPQEAAEAKEYTPQPVFDGQTHTAERFPTKLHDDDLQDDRDNVIIVLITLQRDLEQLSGPLSLDCTRHVSITLHCICPIFEVVSFVFALKIKTRSRQVVLF